MSALQGKSLTQLRGIAQSMGVSDIFKLDDAQLKQAIELKQGEVFPQLSAPVPKPEYDARLMLRPPAKISPKDEAMTLLQPYIERGLHVRWDSECWYMSHGKVNDSGSVRIPLRILLRCAERVLNAS